MTVDIECIEGIDSGRSKQESSGTSPQSQSNEATCSVQPLVDVWINVAGTGSTQDERTQRWLTVTAPEKAQRHVLSTAE